MDHVDISDHSSREIPITNKVINQNGNIDDDSTDNEAGSEWNWEEEAKEDVINNGFDVEMQPLEIVEEKLQVLLNYKEKPAVTIRPKIDDNIDDLDIKNKKLTKIQEQVEDFFSDFNMAPTFQKSSLTTENINTDTSNRLQMSDNGNEIENDGWGDDNTWNDEL